MNLNTYNVAVRIRIPYGPNATVTVQVQASNEENAKILGRVEAARQGDTIRVLSVEVVR